MKKLILLLISISYVSTLAAQTKPKKTAKKAKATKKVSQPAKKDSADKKSDGDKEKKAASPSESPTNTHIKIEYGSTSWNKSSEKIDTAFLFIRDKATKKVIKVFLDESEPDSSIFTGRFSLTLKNQKISPQVFIPPQNSRSAKAAANFNKLLRTGKVEQKPLFFRKDDNRQVIDVFDNKEQLQAAKKAHLEKQKAQKQKKSLVKAIPKKADIEAQERAEALAKEAEEKIREAEMKAERIRLAQIEEQKRLARIEQQKKLKAKERALRIEQAKLLAKQGEQAFQKGDFKKAQDLFEQSIDLNPEDQSYYFMYAVSLYRNEKINQAQVIFKSIEKNKDKDKIVLIRYYLGLIHFRLKEYKESVKYLRYVKKKKTPLAPSAAFYIGLMYFSIKKWDKSQREFEYVLDNSKDPKLDERAEQYIEAIAAQKQYAALLKHRNDISVGLGYMYDSNILLTSDSTGGGSASGIKGDRAVLTTNYGYRAIFNKENSLNIKYDLYYVYSFDSSASAADPFLNTITVPYSYTTKAWGKPLNLTFTPGAEFLFMEDSGGDANGSGTRENILTSYYLTTKALFIKSPTYFAAYTFDLRQDKSTLSTSTGDDNQDALKIALSTDQSFFFDNSKKSGIVGNFGITLNQAEGKNKKYTKIDMGGTYIGGIKSWDASWATGLSLYNSSYSSDDGRVDFNATISASLNKPWSKTWSSALSLSTSSNTSTVESNSYSKYTIFLNGTYSGSF